MPNLTVSQRARLEPQTPGERSRSRTETFELAISGLLTKRADTLAAMLRLREALGEAEADILALDRVLASLGYAGELEAVPPRRHPEAPFGRGQTMRAILNAMREAGEPVTARQIAEGVCRGIAHQDDGPLPVDSLLPRVSKSLGRLKRDGVAISTPDGYGGVRWSLVP